MRAASDTSREQLRRRLHSLATGDADDDER